MRGALVWIVGISVAFFATAGAFLVLANFGTAPKASDPIPQGELSGQDPSAPGLTLRFSEERLAGLERSEDQAVTLYLENRGDAVLESVDLVLTVSSEDTTSPDTRPYRRTITALAPREARRVDFVVDLSVPRGTESMALLDPRPQGDRGILEARAYPQNGPMVVETAVISP